jgi:hypothetical protein
MHKWTKIANLERIENTNATCYIFALIKMKSYAIENKIPNTHAYTQHTPDRVITIHLKIVICQRKRKRREKNEHTGSFQLQVFNQ